MLLPSNFYGSRLYVDVEGNETYIVLAKVTSRKISILWFDKMTDMSLFVNKGDICNLRDFANSFKDFCEQHSVHTTPIIMTGSILGIKEQITKYPALSLSIATSDAKKALKDQKTITLQITYQYFTEIREVDKRVFGFTAATMPESLMEALAKEFRVIGYPIEEFVPQQTSIFNLISLHPCSYDVDYRFIIDLGQTIRLFAYYKNMPDSMQFIDGNFNTLFRQLASTYSIKLEQATELFMKVGFSEDSEINRAVFSKYNIIDTDPYYAQLIEFIGNLCRNLQSSISVSLSTHVTHGYSIVLTGLYACVNKIAYTCENYLHGGVSAVCLNADKQIDNLLISNTCEYTYTPDFATCLGAMLKSQYKNSASFKTNYLRVLSAEVLAKQIKLGLTACMSVCCIAAGVITVAVGAYTYKQFSECKVIEDQNFSVANIKAQYTSIKKQSNLLGKVDTAFSPLIQCINSNNGNGIRIASIDTTNVLSLLPTSGDKTVVNGNKVVTTYNSNDTSSDVSTEGSQQSVLNPNASTSSGSYNGNDTTSSPNGVIKQSESSSQGTNTSILTTESASSDDIIIRGYADSDYSVASFYNELSKVDNIKSCKVNSEREVELPTKDRILFFEIEVEK
jgi:hypothetical protein